MSIIAPELQYINIFDSQSRRLGCFRQITEKSRECHELTHTPFDREQFACGADAASYEKYLDKITKKGSLLYMRKAPWEHQVQPSAPPMPPPMAVPETGGSRVVADIFYHIQTRKLVEQKQQQYYYSRQ